MRVIDTSGSLVSQALSFTNHTSIDPEDIID
jgi:hypothetical protein